MKLNYKNIWRTNKKNTWWKLISKYFELLAEEIPGILAIMFFPSFFGFWIVVPKWDIIIGIISMLLLMKYLKVKGDKNYKEFSDDFRWDLINSIFSLILGIAISIIVAICYTKELFSLESILPTINMK